MATRRFTVEILGDAKSLERAVVKTDAALKTVDRQSTKSSAGLHRFGGALDQVSSKAAGLGRVLAKVGAVGLGAVAVHAATGGLLQLAGTASQASGALVALPAAGLAAAAVFGTVKLATAGMGKAFTAIGADNAPALAKALNGMTPVAREFVLQIKALKPALDHLRMGVQEKLFAGLAGQVKTLAGQYLPRLRTGLGGIATVLNSGALDLGKALGSKATAGTLTGFLDTVKASLKELLPAIRPLVGAFTLLVGVGGTALPRLAASMGQLAQRFAAFITKAANSGALGDFLNTGITVAGQLAHVLGDVVKILGDVFKAAGQSATGVFGILGQLLDGVHAFLSSAGGQSALLDFFTAAGTLLHALMPLLMTVATTIGTVVAPALSGIGKALIPGLTAVVAGLGPILAHLAPAIQAVLGSLADALPALLPGLSALGDAIGQSLAALAPALGPLAGALAAIVVAIAPILPLAAHLFAELLAQAAPVVTRLAQALTPVIAQLIKQLAPILPQIVIMFGDLLTNLEPVVVALAQQLVPVLPGLSTNGIALVQAMMPLVPLFAGLLVLLAPVVGWIAKVDLAFQTLQRVGVTLVIGALKALLLVVLDVFGGILDAAAKAFGWVPGLGDKLKAARDAFHKFRDDVNTDLALIKARKTITLEIVEKTTVKGAGRGTGLSQLAGVRQLASGGSFLPGLALVGEQGPELVNFTRPGRVTPAGPTRDLLAGGGQTTINVYVTNPAATGAEIGRELAWAMRTA